MTNSQNNSMMIAANLCNFPFSLEQVELLTRLYEAVKGSNGDLTIRDIAKIQVDVAERHKNFSFAEMMDKYSSKE